MRELTSYFNGRNSKKFEEIFNFPWKEKYYQNDKIENCTHSHNKVATVRPTLIIIVIINNNNDNKHNELFAFICKYLMNLSNTTQLEYLF